MTPPPVQPPSAAADHRRWTHTRPPSRPLQPPPPNCINFYFCWVYLLMQFGLGVPDNRLREADVRRQRRWCGRLQQGWQRLQCHESSDCYRRRLRCTRPSHPNSAHGRL